MILQVVTSPKTLDGSRLDPSERFGRLDRKIAEIPEIPERTEGTRIVHPGNFNINTKKRWFEKGQLLPESRYFFGGFQFSFKGGTAFSRFVQEFPSHFKHFCICMPICFIFPEGAHTRCILFRVALGKGELWMPFVSFFSGRMA